MALMATAVSVAASIIFTPFLMFILCIIFLASIGKSLGVRRLYVNILIKIFEYGRQHIEVANRVRRPDEDNDEDDDDGEEEPDPEWGAAAYSGAPRAGARSRGSGDGEGAPSASLANGQAVAANGHSKSMVIKREDLILAPDPGLNYKRTGSQERLSSPSNETSIPLSASNGIAPLPAEESGPDILGRENGIQHTLLITPATPTQTEGATETVLDFDLSSCLEYVKAGMEAIIEDQVTSVFEAEELRSWNLLTRTNRHYEFVSWRLTVIWVMGFFVRYFFLLPLRILICFIGVIYFLVTMPLIGLIPESAIQRFLGDLFFKIGFRMLARSLSCVLTFHNQPYKPLGGGFCVANHTSPIDVVMMSSETCFSLIGQRHGGFLGLLQRALARASPHIWFERSEAKDRNAVAKRLKQHVSDPHNPPILIFPEGTCINNTSVMQFKKGSFEVGGVIYPVAIKYDARFGDAFWNSSRYGMLHYLYMMMSSWAIVCDVWYLPPMYRQPHESAIDFANRVKSVIARQGGLVDLMWDGQLKRMKPKKEWKELQQEEFTRRLKGE